MCVCVCVLVQGGSLGVLPGHLADHLQRAGASPRPDEGQEELLQHERSSVCLSVVVVDVDVFPPQRVTGCILSNVNTPSTTPVIGQPQNQTPPIYQNHNNMTHKPTASECGPSRDQ